MFDRVAIIGLGLLGGSMGLALHRSGAAREVTGYDLGKGVSDRAYKVGSIDRPFAALADAVRGAEHACEQYRGRDRAGAANTVERD